MSYMCFFSLVFTFSSHCQERCRWESTVEGHDTASFQRGHQTAYLNEQEKKKKRIMIVFKTVMKKNVQAKCKAAQFIEPHRFAGYNKKRENTSEQLNTVIKSQCKMQPSHALHNIKF